MHVTVVTNQALSHPTCDPGSVWTAGYDHPSAQIFAIDVSAETAAEVGQTVGLTQTLRASARVATYATGGHLSLEPAAGPPCLDGDEDRIPWYNQFCEGRRLPAIGTSVRFTMRDVPATHTKSSARSSATATHTITSLAVAETFLLSLIDHDRGNAVIKQWLWQYSYEFAPANDAHGVPNVRATPRLVNHHESVCQEQAHVLPIVVVGPVATERNHNHDVWTPASWRDFNHED